MTPLSIRLVFSGLVLLGAMPAAAQDRTWGLLFGYPGSVGVQWDVTGKFAVRVDGDYERDHATLTTGMGDPPPRSVTTSVTFMPITDVVPARPIFISSMTETTHQSGSIAVSGLFTLHESDQLKIYVAPRAGVAIVNSTSRTDWDVSGLPPALLAAITFPADVERSHTDYAPDISAKFGASYRLGDRFGVFGETGFGYVRRAASTDGSTIEATLSSFGLRAGIGGILYF